MVDAASNNPCSTLEAAAPRIRCPVLLVHGDKDLVVPASRAKNIAELITRSGGHSQLVVLEGAGHMLLKFQANDCAELIQTFIKNTQLGLAPKTRSFEQS